MHIITSASGSTSSEPCSAAAVKSSGSIRTNGDSHAGIAKQTTKSAKLSSVTAIGSQAALINIWRMEMCVLSNGHELCSAVVTY